MCANATPQKRRAEPDTVTTKIKDIRSKMRVEKTDKIQDGKKRAKAGSTTAAVGTESGGQEVTEDGRAGGEGPKVRFWDVPEEFEVDYTKGEDLKDVIQGPDYAWHRDVHRDLPPHHGRDGTSAPQEAKHLVQKAQELGKSPALQALEGATDDLYAWAAARVAREPGVELSSLLQEMATYGMGELAREAAELLEQREGTKAGSARLVVRDTLWAEGQPGQGSVELDGTTWRLWDYQEDVMMTEDLAALLHLPEVSIERRQCVTITIAAMVEWKEKGRRPSVEQVQTRAQSLRLEQTRLAVDAANTIGEAEEMVAAVEHEVRTYIHDLTTAHHEKDFRSLAVFPLEALADCRLVVFRADYRGGLVVECIIGSNWIDGGWTTFALIWKGHMVLLEPPDGYDLERFLAREDPQTTPAMGFTFFWHARHDQPPTAPGKIFCRLCKAGRKAGESLNAPRHSCLSYTAATAGGTMDIHHDHNVIRAVRGAGQPHEPGQLVLREFFAGKGGISAEWSKTSPIMEPVEVYERPHDKQGYRAHFDLSRKDVHNKFLAEVRTGPSNVHWIAAPCTSYCDWQQKNGGTRTFECPEGTGQGPLAATEATGNILSMHAAELFEASLDSGAFPLVESSGVSGRYPKQWDLPCWKRILNRPDVEYVDLPMCAFGLGPPDEPDHFYVHKTRVVFPLHPPLRRALRRVCPGLSTSHRHIGLKGCRDGQTVTRCTEAGVYAQNFVSVVVAVLQASLGGGLALPPQDGHRAGGLRDRGGDDGEDGGALLPGDREEAGGDGGDDLPGDLPGDDGEGHDGDGGGVQGHDGDGGVQRNDQPDGDGRGDGLLESMGFVNHSASRHGDGLLEVLGFPEGGVPNPMRHPRAVISAKDRVIPMPWRPMRSSSAPAGARERSPRGSSRPGGGKGKGGWLSFARGGSSSSSTSEPNSDVEGGGRKSTRVEYPYGLSRAERYRLGERKGQRHPRPRRRAISRRS